MAFTALLFSCSKDAMDDELLPVTRAQLSIGLEDKSEVERQEEIKSIRFIVFSNASGDVKLNVNKLVTLDTPATATDITAKNLEVITMTIPEPCSVLTARAAAQTRRCSFLPAYFPQLPQQAVPPQSLPSG